MKFIYLKKSYKLLFAIVLVVSAQPGLAQAGAMSEVTKLQSRWAQVNYQLQGDDQQQAFEQLVSEADSITRTYPESAEAWIWNGIIKSSYAGARGGLGALGLVKESRAALEKALTINPAAMQGSAYTSLGTLYFKVPGWPIAFGDDDKAEELLKKALAINPDGIDSNYFYAEYLEDKGDYAEAKKYLLKAQQAAPRLSRPVADAGRQKQISQLLASIDKQLSSSGEFE